MSGGLRVAIVVTNFPSISETFILNQITGLIDRGHTVDIIAERIKDEGVVHPDVERYGLLAHTYTMLPPANLMVRAARAAGLALTRLPRRPGLWRAFDVLHHGRAALTLHTFYASLPFLTRYDVVHCQYGTNGESVGALMKALGLQRKLVTTFHGYDLRLGERGGPALFRELRRQGDCFLSISEHTRRRLIAFGFDPARIIYHPVGIDVRRFEPLPRSDPSAEPVRVVTVARLVPQKGLQTGILAVAKVLRDAPGLELRYDVIGGGPLYGELTRLVESLGLQGTVRLRGPQPQDRVIAALRRSDIFVLTSVEEVLPVSLMEAQATGLPVVASAVAATGEIIQDAKSGFLVPTGNVDAVAAKLRLLIDRPTLRREFGESGRRHIKSRFDVNVLNDRLVEIYRQVVHDDLPARLNAGPEAVESAPSIVG